MESVKLFYKLILLTLLLVSCSKFHSTEKMEEECESGNGESCMHLAQSYKTDKNQSLIYYIQACNVQIAEGCTEAALNYLLVRKDISNALKLLDKSCKLDASKKGCWWLGSIVGKGYLVTQNYQEAYNYWSRACNARDIESCVEIANLYRDGRGLLPQNVEKARELYQIACRTNDIKACVSYEELTYASQKNNNLEEKYKQAYQFEHSTGNIEALNKAMTLYHDSCTKGYVQACLRLGQLYETGQRGMSDKQKAIEYFSLACNQQNANACISLGRLQENKNIQQAFLSYSKACNLNDFKACSLAGYLAGTKANNTHHNQKIIYQLSKKACDNDEANGCLNLGYLFSRWSKFPDYQKAAEYFEKACQKKIADACFSLAGLYIKNQGVTYNKEKVEQLLNDACNNKIYSACHMLKNLSQANQIQHSDDSQSNQKECNVEINENCNGKNIIPSIGTPITPKISDGISVESENKEKKLEIVKEPVTKIENNFDNFNIKDIRKDTQKPINTLDNLF